MREDETFSSPLWHGIPLPHFFIFASVSHSIYLLPCMSSHANISSSPPSSLLSKHAMTFSDTCRHAHTALPHLILPLSILYLFAALPCPLRSWTWILQGVGACTFPSGGRGKNLPATCLPCQGGCSWRWREGWRALHGHGMLKKKEGYAWPVYYSVMHMASQALFLSVYCMPVFACLPPYLACVPNPSHIFCFSFITHAFPHCLPLRTTCCW